MPNFFLRITGCFLSFLLLSQCQQADAPEYIFRAGHVANQDHTWHQAFLYFGEILEERTNGRIKIEVYSAEQLGKEIELIQKHTGWYC